MRNSLKYNKRHYPYCAVIPQLIPDMDIITKFMEDNNDKSVVKDVVSALKKATKAHSGQAKDLEKAMKTEADQHGDEINDKKTKASMTKGEKEPKKLHADSGSKMTKVETEPKVDYKN